MREHDISVWLYSEGTLREVKSPRVAGSKPSLAFALFIFRNNPGQEAFIKVYKQIPHWARLSLPRHWHCSAFSSGPNKPLSCEQELNTVDERLTFPSSAFVVFAAPSRTGPVYDT